MGVFGCLSEKKQLIMMMKKITMLMFCLAAITVSGATKLNDAVEDENYVKILELIAQGEDVNEKNADGWAPLIRAASFNNVDAMRAILLAPGVDINIRIGNFNSAGKYRGQTALMRASYVASADAVDLLLEQPEIDMTDKVLMVTPL